MPARGTARRYDADGDDAARSPIDRQTTSSASPETWCGCWTVTTSRQSVVAACGWYRFPNDCVRLAAHAAEDVTLGFDSFGRTWHRQECSGPGRRRRSNAGQSVLGGLEPWLFRRYLSRADETGIKALKRRIQMAARLHQDDWRVRRLARGGLRDLESTVEFLQLLVGGDQPAVRAARHARGDCRAGAGRRFSRTKSDVLEENYVVLRRLEHRLQIRRQRDSRLRSCRGGRAGKPGPLAGAEPARRMNSAATCRTAWLAPGRPSTTARSAFAEEPPTPREVDLLLDPDPPGEEIRAALAPFGFARPGGRAGHAE